MNRLSLFATTGLITPRLIVSQPTTTLSKRKRRTFAAAHITTSTFVRAPEATFAAPFALKSFFILRMVISAFYDRVRAKTSGGQICRAKWILCAQNGRIGLNCSEIARSRKAADRTGQIRSKQIGRAKLDRNSQNDI